MASFAPRSGLQALQVNRPYPGPLSSKLLFGKIQGKEPGNIIESRFDPAREAKHCQQQASEMAKLGFLGCLVTFAAMYAGSESMGLFRTAGIATATAATVSAVMNDLKYRWLQRTTLRHPAPR